MLKPSKAATDQHHKACVPDRACHADCRAWQPSTRATHSAVVYYDLKSGRAVPDERGEVVRERGVGRLQGESAPPLWEHLDEGVLSWLRHWGVRPPRPEGYHAYERVVPGLDAWTSDDGKHAQELDRAVTGEEKARRRVVFENSEKSIRRVAEELRTVYPEVDRLLEMAWSEHQERSFVACCLVSVVYVFALVRLGYDHDPLPEHILGRLLPGAPVRDLRAPFRDARAAYLLAAGNGDRSGGTLGGGRCAWPAEDPRTNGRTSSRWLEEIYVRGTTRSAAHVTGEASVHVGLSAALARRRAKLTPLEEQIAAVMLDGDLARSDRLERLRAIRLRAQGGNPETLCTAETRRLRALRAAIVQFPLNELSEETAKKLREAEEGIAARESVDAEAYPALLRAATPDVTDGQLLREGRAVVAKIEAAVHRPSREGDALADRRAPRRRARPSPELEPATVTFASEVL